MFHCHLLFPWHYFGWWRRKKWEKRARQRWTLFWCIDETRRTIKWSLKLMISKKSQIISIKCRFPTKDFIFRQNSYFSQENTMNSSTYVQWCYRSKNPVLMVAIENLLINRCIYSKLSDKCFLHIFFPFPFLHDLDETDLQMAASQSHFN